MYNEYFAGKSGPKPAVAHTKVVDSKWRNNPEEEKVLDSRQYDLKMKQSKTYSQWGFKPELSAPPKTLPKKEPFAEMK